MVLLGAADNNNHQVKSLNKTVTAVTQNQAVIAADIPVEDIVVRLDWTGVNMAFVSKIFVLILIVLMAVLNYISFLSQKEDS